MSMMRKPRTVIRRQRRVVGGRTPLPACVIDEIYEEVERQARKFGVSRSFVIAVALADQFGIEEQEKYVADGTKHWKKPLLTLAAPPLKKASR
jgi:hypothetical protein